MGLSSGWVTRVDRQGAVVLAAIAAWGLAIIGFGFAPALWLAVLCLAVAGAADMVSAVLRTSMLQIAAPEEMRGRMQGVFIVVVAGGPRLGDLRAGALATATSVTVAMVSGGVVIVVAMVVVALVVPSFWLFRASRSAEARPGSPAPESGEDRPGALRRLNEYTTSGRLGTGNGRFDLPGRQARAWATTARSATRAS